MLHEIMNTYGKDSLSECDKDKLYKLHLELDSIYEDKARGADPDRKRPHFYN